MSTQHIKPLLDRILVKRVNLQSKSVIIKPERFQELSTQGEVIATGDIVVLGGVVFPMEQFVKVGDFIRFGDMNIDDLDDDHVYGIVRIQDVRGVIPKPAQDENFEGGL